MFIWRILILLIFWTNITSALSFNTVTQALQFAQNHDEYPEADNSDINNALYISTYKEQAPNWFHKMLYYFGVKSSFYKLLDNILEQRKELFGEKSLKRRTVVLKVKPKSKYIVLSNIQGDFHSLARILKDLQDTNIINDNYKIKDANTSIILNGDIIGNLPYTVQTLEVVLHILQNNPDQCFYIPGIYEDRQNWKGQQFDFQVNILFPYHDNINNKLVNFFRSLPLGIYVLFQNQEKRPVRISYFISNAEFTALNCEVVSEKEKAVCILNPHSGLVQGPLSALVLGQDKLFDFYKNTPGGIQFGCFPSLLTYNNSSNNLSNNINANNKPICEPVWSIISSPTKYYRQNYGLSYESYGVITWGESASDSTMSCRFRDIDLNQDFYTSGAFNLLTGESVN